MTSLYSYSGALSEESPTYIKRDADDQLFNALKDGRFCYVLESRQTGKSSLRVQIMKRLKDCGIYYCVYDMSAKGLSAKNDEEWYCDQIKSFISDFIRNYNIDLLNKNTKPYEVSSKFKKWWEARSGSSLGKYEDFLEGCLLKNIKGNIVFLIDEIDSVIDLPFSVDDFFGFIRGCHENRGNNKQYERLTFCLMGVASPNSLIADKDKRTPFNIGTPITLSPFPTDLDNGNSLEMMKPLLDGGLEDKNMLQEILDWTGGQPFLTQRLCALIVNKRQDPHLPFTNVKEVVISEIINNWQAPDQGQVQVHLETIRGRLIPPKNKNDVKVYDRLKLYQEILENGQISYNKTDEQIQLRLSGLVLQTQGKLKLYNRIYKEIFNQSWVEQERAKLRLYVEEFDNWEKWKAWKKDNNLAHELEERYLLYGTKCDEVQRWRHNFAEGLLEKDAIFLNQSQIFWEEVKHLFSALRINEGVIESIIRAANDLTGGLSQFNRIIFKIAKNNNVVDLQREEVQGWLENLVLSNSSNLKLFEEYEQFQQDRNQFLNQDDSFDLISLFAKISQKEPILFDENNPQHRKLKDMCFIILDKEHNLRILNKIYEKILDQNSIKAVMTELRPYTKAFRDWQHSDRQESSYLLQNNDLKLALEWLRRKPTPKLEEGEIKFVMTSLVAEVWTTASPSVQSEAISFITTFRPSLQGKNNYSDFLLQEILEWTRLEPLLLKELLEEVDKTEISTTNYHKWIKQLVKTQIINNWQHHKLAEHFRLIEQGLTNNQSSESFWLIVKYRQILLQGKIGFDETRENTKLIELGLVIKIDQQLEIANLIYKNIFDQSWTYQKLSEYKRIRARNLLKWCRANKPKQNDPVLRSYLDEWINNNLPIVEKIFQYVQGEVLDNKFNFIDEIKLLTYDIVKMDFVQDSQIQLCLDRTFDKETKKMKQDNLDKLLSTIVEEGSAIEAVAIVNLEEGGLEYYNKELETSKPEIYRALFGQRDASEALADFADLKGIPTALKTFGAATKYGALEYSLFYLNKGIVIVDFLDLPEVTVAICFIATTEANPTKIVRQYRDRINDLKSELQKALG